MLRRPWRNPGSLAMSKRRELYFPWRFIDPEFSHHHSLSSLAIVLTSAIVPHHGNTDVSLENPKQEVIWKFAEISPSSPARVKMVSFRVFASVIQRLFEFESELFAELWRNTFVISDDFQDLAGTDGWNSISLIACREQREIPRG